MSEVKTYLIITLKTLTFQVSFINIVSQGEVDWSAIFPLLQAVNIKTYFFYAKPSEDKLLLETHNNSKILRPQRTIFLCSSTLKENLCFWISKVMMHFRPLIVSIMTFIISHFTCVYISEGTTHRKDQDTIEVVMWSAHEKLNALSIHESRSFHFLLNLYIKVTD